MSARAESFRGRFEAMSWQQMIASNAGPEAVEGAKLIAVRRKLATTSDGIEAIALIRDGPHCKTPRPLAEAFH